MCSDGIGHRVAAAIAKLLHCVGNMRLFFPTAVGCLMLADCSAYKCIDESCRTDAAITANVTALFARYCALSANTVRIQTLHQVIYLTGTVDTDVERFLAVSVAGTASGVTRVVDSINVNNTPR